MSNVDELEKIFVEHPAYSEMKKNFIKEGLQESVPKYLEKMGNILYMGTPPSKDVDKKLYYDLQRFMATRILSEFPNWGRSIIKED